VGCVAAKLIELDPLGEDEAAGMVVPLHNLVMSELHPDRQAKGVEEFRSAFSAPEAAYRFVAVLDEHSRSLRAIGVIRMWVDGTNAQLLSVQILVRSDSRRRGLGRLILEEALEVAEVAGRSVVMFDTFDTVPAGQAFAVAMGAEVGIREHISRLSVSDLDVGRLELWMAEGQVRAPDHELLRWLDGYPQPYLDQIASLFVMADADMPYEGAPFEPITETAASLQTRLDASSAFVKRVTSAAVHRPSGTVVGFSELINRTSNSSALFTALTMVHRDHRGHGLGKWLKADTITRAITRFPEASRLHTENAYSNDAMLAINNAIGFVPHYTLTSYQLPASGIRPYPAR